MASQLTIDDLQRWAVFTARHTFDGISISQLCGPTVEMYAHINAKQLLGSAMC
jgi:hypothetical protein